MSDGDEDEMIGVGYYSVEEALEQLLLFTQECEAGAVLPECYSSLIVGHLIQNGNQYPTSSFCLAVPFHDGFELKGRGTDLFGKYSLFGQITKGRLQYVKKYDSKEYWVKYDGILRFLESETSTSECVYGIEGEWIIPEMDQGTFSFTLKIFPFHYLEFTESNEVEIAIENICLTSVDSLLMTFNAQFSLRMTWIVKHSDLLKLATGQNVTQLDWEPDAPKLANAVEPPELDISPTSISYDEKRMLLVATRVVETSGTFREPMELHQFPMDIQSLPILMEFESKNVTHGPTIAIVPREKRFIHQVIEKGLLTEYFVRSPRYVLSTTERLYGLSYDLKPKKSILHSLAVKLYIERNAKFYHYKVVTVMILIEVCASLVFVIPADDIASRLGFSSTMLLTAIAFQFVVASYLPRVDYLTLLDQYLLIVTGHIATTLFQCCVMTWGKYYSDSDSDAVVVLNILTVPIITVIFGVVSWQLSLLEQSKLNEGLGIVSSGDSNSHFIIDTQTVTVSSDSTKNPLSES